jgi:hypothetical protein
MPTAPGVVVDGAACASAGAARASATSRRTNRLVMRRT